MPIVSARMGDIALLLSCEGCWAARFQKKSSRGPCTPRSLPVISTSMGMSGSNFKHWRFYGENGLAGEEVSVWVYEGTLKIEYQATALSLYSVRLSPDQQITEVKNPRRIETHFRSPQVELSEVQ
jgi:hypothetical protein